MERKETDKKIKTIVQIHAPPSAIVLLYIYI